MNIYKNEMWGYPFKTTETLRLRLQVALFLY